MSHDLSIHRTVRYAVILLALGTIVCEIIILANRFDRYPMRSNDKTKLLAMTIITIIASLFGGSSAIKRHFHAVALYAIIMLAIFITGLVTEWWVWPAYYNTVFHGLSALAGAIFAYMVH